MDAIQPVRLGAIGNLGDLLCLVFDDMRSCPLEQLRVLFLDRHMYLLGDEVIARGGVDEVPLALRGIVHRALDLGAAGLILVHNHPSGNPEPSAADLSATALLASVCRPLGILVHDHLIVASAGWSSFRARGLV
jgi:DNA repair protein RadC